MSCDLRALLATLPQTGSVRWIGLRPARREPPIRVTEVEALSGTGLVGDRFRGTLQSKRQVTLIQEEHLEVIARLLRREHIDAALLRRNVVVSGINLFALQGVSFRVGTAVLIGTGQCHPCSRMEEVLGAGGYNAMRGHGGITARVEQPGWIRIGDEVRALTKQ